MHAWHTPHYETTVDRNKKGELIFSFCKFMNDHNLIPTLACTICPMQELEGIVRSKDLDLKSRQDTIER